MASPRIVEVVGQAPWVLGARRTPLRGVLPNKSSVIRHTTRSMLTAALRDGGPDTIFLA